MNKKASPLHLLMGIPGHIAVNVGGRAAHHATNLAEVLAHHGFQHGASGAQIAPAMLRSMQLIAGPESVGNYQLARWLGEKFYAMEPAVRQQAMKALSEGKSHPALAEYQHLLTSGGPISAPILQAIQHDVAGTAPKFTARSMGESRGVLGKAEAGAGRLYGGLVDRMRRVEQSPFATPMQKGVANAVGVAPVAAMTALDPYGSISHFAINAGRDLVGSSQVGTDFMKNQFHRGLHGQGMSKGEGLAWDLLVSPAVMDPRREGLVGHATGALPHIQQNLPVARAVAPHVVPPKHQQAVQSALGFAHEMAQPPKQSPGILDRIKGLFSSPSVKPPTPSVKPPTPAVVKPPSVPAVRVPNPVMM